MEKVEINQILRFIINEDESLPIILKQYDSFLYDILTDSPYGKDYIIETLKKYPDIYDSQIKYIKNNIFKENNNNISMNILIFLQNNNEDIKSYLKTAIDKYLFDNPTMYLELAKRYGYANYCIDKLLIECEKESSFINYLLIVKLIDIVDNKTIDKLLNKYLNSLDEINSFELENLYNLLHGNKKIFDILIGFYLSNKDIKSIVKLIKESKESSIEVNKYIDKSLFKKMINDYIRNDYIFDLGNILSDVIPNEVNEMFEVKYDYLINRLAKIMVGPPVNAPKDSRELIIMFLEELLNNQNVKLQDIHILEAGGYSNVVNIGSLVMKVSKKKETFDIKNSKYILQPVLRRQFEEYKNLTIEVVPLVETELISMEELKELYFNLRDEGLIWTDVKAVNVGKLLKPNKAIYNMRTGPIETSSESTGLNGEVQVLPKGKYVVIDSDYIYNEINRKTKYPENSLYEEFENDYINYKNRQNTFKL